MKQLDYSKLIATSWADQFDEEQVMPIKKGLAEGVDVSSYANPEFDHIQMWEIYHGLTHGVDVRVYANPEYDWRLMSTIRQVLEYGGDTTQLEGLDDWTAQRLTEILSEMDKPQL